jgi:hypothetical protein
MKLIKKLNEDAAGGAVGGGGASGAGAVAAHPMPLFSNLVKRGKPKSKRIKRMVKEDQDLNSGVFDTAHVISKLKALEKKETTDLRDTVTFGIEDENKQLVRVSVKQEQADSFEQALQSFLTQQDEQEPLDVAEMLFALKDQFDIVDVVWPDVVEDEEQDMELNPQGAGGMPSEDGAMGMGGEEGDGGMPGEEGAGDMEAGMGDVGDVGGTEDEKSLLTQIVDMMKADAEARKAEAIAKSAEAKAREAAAAHAQILTKVKQEEQFLDMEAHNKQRKEAEREAKRLAQLARYKHEMSNERGDSFGDDDEYDPADVINAIGSKHRGSDEEEEVHMRRPDKVAAPRTGKRVSPADIAKFVLSRVK